MTSPTTDLREQLAAVAGLSGAPPESIRDYLSQRLVVVRAELLDCVTTRALTAQATDQADDVRDEQLAGYDRRIASLNGAALQLVGALEDR